MLFMVVETFRNGDPRPVYRRFAERGRMAPEGVRYVGSWIDESLGRCFQVLEAERRELLDSWIANWSDLVAFEVIPVVTSEEAARRVTELQDP